jgi:hypothetical protein
MRRLFFVGIAIVALASSLAAHINVLRGRLVDLVRQSDVIIIGVVTLPASLSPDRKSLGINVVETLRGELDQKALTAQTSARLINSERQVIFLKREGSGFRCVQPSGTRFPATPADDAVYRGAIDGIAAALRLPEDQQVHPLRAALIPALSSKSLPLRYHAALELSSLQHEGHELTAEERTAIEKVRSAPDFDPSLRDMVEGLLRQQVPGQH